MQTVGGVIILLIWIAVCFFNRTPRAGTIPPTRNVRIKKVLNALVFIIIALGALAKEILDRYYSSPTPQPELGRTVSTSGIEEGVIIYITPEANRLAWAWFVVCLVVFIAFMFWPSKERTNNDG